MPTLTWVGKEKVIHHHRDVPYRVLNKQYHYQSAILAIPKLNSSADPNKNPDTETSLNRIIHGDNLEALKSLLPEFEGRVNCIYIDPPYNTGNEGWVYNDAVNDPKIKKWLGKVVGPEGEDLSRHDKWLCMMYPRLKLLHRLLADDGSIFISIDDNEQAHLKLVMDEVFGGSNFVADFIWQHRKSSQNDTDVSLSHNHTFCFAKKRSQFSLKPLGIADEKFKNPDNDPRGAWVADPMDAPGIRENLSYSITNPNTQESFYPPNGRHWRFTEDKYLEALRTDRIIFGKTGKSKPQFKRFLSEAEAKGTNPFTIWNDIDTATDGTKQLMAVFDGEKVFDTPKPIGLLAKIFQLATDKNSLILDSFAGSGTAAHAVLKLNAHDNGNRRFILIETMEYAETITAERVRRVMSGYGGDNKAVAGLGGSFDYYTVGERLLLENGMLNPAVGLPAIRDYVAWTEGIPIGQCAPLTPTATEGNASSPYWLGEAHGLGVFFVWDDTNPTTLDLSLLTQLVKRTGRYLIYADQCALGEDFMRRHNITYKKIPRDITRL